MQYIRYWNDDSIESQKPWGIEDVHDTRLLSYLKEETNLMRSFEACLAFAEENFNAMQGTFLDLGAGVCWTTALISRWPRVTKVHVIDYSKHRLYRIAPLVFQQLAAAEEKIGLHCRPMHPLPYADESVDAVVFCQALYMNSSPREMLSEVYRVLKEGGILIIACETIEKSESMVYFWFRAAKILWQRWLSKKPLTLSNRIPDSSGRFQYFEKEYQLLMQRAGFKVIQQHLGYPIFKESRVMATNYFGVK